MNKRDKDNREWKRVSVTIDAKCRLVEEAKYYEVWIVDIHHQGCCIKSQAEFKKGEEIRIVADVPVEGSLYLTGIVVWSMHGETAESFRSGVRFVVNTPEAEQNYFKLYNYCTMQ